MSVFELCEKYFCCPRCKGLLRAQPFPGTSDGLLICYSCRYPYIILDNIPVMLPYSLIPEYIMTPFRNKYPQVSKYYQGIPGEDRVDAVKVTQINAWGTQYDVRPKSFPRERITPPTTQTFLHDLFYPNTKKLLWERIVGHNGFFLELGRGDGAFVSVAAKNFAMYFGMDISYEAIRSCYNRYPYKNCVFLVGDAENIPLREGLMDACVAQWLLGHLANPEIAAREMVRVLKPGGVAYMDTNHARFVLTYRWFQLIFTPKKYWRRMEEAGHSHDRFFTRARLVRLFEHAGLMDIETHLAYFLLDMLMNNHLLGPLLASVTQRSSLAHGGSPYTSMISEGSQCLEFQEKTDFKPFSAKGRRVIETVNRLLEGLRFFFVPDRLLEVCGQGESVVLVGNKPSVQGQGAAREG